MRATSCRSLQHNKDTFNKANNKAERRFLALCFVYDRNYKPGSVIDSHLSRRTVAGTLKPPPRRRSGRPCVSSTVLLRIEFTAPRCSHAAGELLPRLSTLTLPRGAARRYISVALFLKSPSAGVTRYPCPVEPGLSSCERRWALTRGCPFRSLYYCTLFFFLCQTDCKISFLRL